jgi:hypothetical protein
MKAESETLWMEAKQSLLNSPETFFGNLTGEIARAADDQHWYVKRMRDCEERSKSSIGRYVGTGEFLTPGMQFARDASATVMVVTGGVMASAGVATAGVVAGTLAVGSALKGVATYQDYQVQSVKYNESARIGAAVVSGVGTLVVGYFPIWAKGHCNFTVVYVTSVLSAGATGAQAIIEGKNMKQVLAESIGAVVGQVAGAKVQSHLAKVGAIAQVAALSSVDLAINAGTKSVSERLGTQSQGSQQQSFGPPATNVTMPWTTPVPQHSPLQWKAQNSPVHSDGDFSAWLALEFPKTDERIDFIGLPSHDARDFVSRYALRAV